MFGFGYVKKEKYDELKHANELLRDAITNLENALRNTKIKLNELRLKNEIIDAEREAAVNDLFSYTGSLVRMYDENGETVKELNIYKEAAEKIADIVLALPWNNATEEADTDGNYDTVSTFTMEQ